MAIGAIMGAISVAGAITKAVKSHKAKKEQESATEAAFEADQETIAAAEAEQEKIKLQQEKALAEIERQKQQSTVPGMKPAYGSPVFNPATQQTMGALSGANPGADPSLPYQGGENALLENALSGLYS